MAEIPRATARLQLNADFDFRAAAAVVPYLARLGISHVYASPVTMARPGSTHGYDVIDHTRINPELGGEAGLAALQDALDAHGMGLILDFVPNHMGVGGADNPYWLDLLEWGRDSDTAHWFDIDWDPAEETLKNKVLVPFLGTDYASALEAGEIKLAFDPDGGSFSAWYYEHRLPICPRDYAHILARADACPTLAGTIQQAKALTRRRRARKPDKDAAAALKAELAALAEQHEDARAALEQAAERFNGEPGKLRSFLDLHRLLERQQYRPAYWRTATDEINYRRFFDINDLAGMRVEDAAVFHQMHSLLLELIERGVATGVRLDHVDGLYDPAAYMTLLQKEAGARLGAGGDDRPLYLLAEKILAPFERLPADWAVHGTTGYDFMAEATGVLIDPGGERPLTRLYTRLTGRPGDFEDVIVQAKYQVLRNNLAAEFTVLARRIARLAKRHWQTRDFTYQSIRAALADILAQVPVYRTYIAEGPLREEDRRYINWAVARAMQMPGLVDESVYIFLREVLLSEWRPRGGRARGAAREVREIARKAQQLTGPVTAKSVEDTAFYRHARFLALNEVGSDPGRWAMSVNAFHRAMEERVRERPASMLATATHDHKRGEDVRARLAVVSERPQDWTHAVTRFFRLNRSKRTELEEIGPAPAPNAEYFYYQTLLGAWPLDLAPDDTQGLAAFAERMEAVMIKSLREAKLHTNWAKPNETYETAVLRFVRTTLDPKRARAFLKALHGVVEEIAPAGTINALAQTVLKYSCPGVPDLYQSTEFWDFSLVDPDNRRAVDFEARARALDRLAETSWDELLGQWRDGRIKQAIIARLLDLRRDKPALFAEGDYARVDVDGPAADHVFAFERRHGEERLLIAVPRLIADSAQGTSRLSLDPSFWMDTRLEADLRGLTDLLTRCPAEDARLATLFATLPVCVLAGPLAPEASSSKP